MLKERGPSTIAKTETTMTTARRIKHETQADLSDGFLDFLMIILCHSVQRL